ncbi:hypothetical protein H6P81_001036 [Aristolochia fimbriata]|uniref:Protein kinase domain-containing protein n=1 Tax=Aristolochia fimbriata TaxID=158543 RepID=A0AAV7FAD0_ARIFI|nr:hypothetical protein H6P81_001036 [Aristolochia fimbriata]
MTSTPLARILFTLFLLALARAQQDFISIDCGLREGTNYTDDGTGIFYTSDAGFIDTGESREIDPSLISTSLAAQYRNLRSFPVGDRNCYTLKPIAKKNRYLVRASFMHGNYDGAVMPVFDLYLGVNLWTEVALHNSSRPVWKEIITVATADYIPVCLVRKQGKPFISVLEVRALAFAMYNASDEARALVLYDRYDVGSSSRRILRYKDDAYDRIWSPFQSDAYTALNTTSTVANDIPMFQPPATVLSTAVAPANGSADVMYFNWSIKTPEEQFLVYWHIAEVKVLLPWEVREFNVCVTDYPNSCFSHYRPTYLVATSVYTMTPFSGRLQYSCSFVRTEASTLPPIFNAIEIYTLANFSVVTTNDEDVNSIMGVKSGYRVTRNWNGDPCVPPNYTWEGVGCSYRDPTSPRIVTLDLSANKLTGEIPDFLATLSSLTFLNLSGNNLNGPVPSALLQRSKSGTLQLSVDSNLSVYNSDTCTTSSCKKKKKSAAVPVSVSLSAVALILLVAGFIFRRKFGRRRAADSDPVVKASDGNVSFNLENRRFTYAELKSITSDFQNVLGAGGFGTVYYGRVDDDGKTQVAVKLLSQKSTQGSKNFKIEAQMLTKVYHGNLVQLIGYCAEGSQHMALILEYMTQGNLSNFVLGLEYLHNGCKPPIIHRDVKSANILLNERLEAKIADFGLSKVFYRGPNGEFTRIKSDVRGTFGYLDPEYSSSFTMNEKSDVYSYGVVLLELITGKSAIFHTSSDSPGISLVQWVRPFVSKGNIRDVIDGRMKENYDVNSASKAIGIATACTHPKGANRPTMSTVIFELKRLLGSSVHRIPERNSEYFTADD